MQTSYGDNCQLLLRLWDYFIIDGWKAVFKASVVILKENEDALLGMPFEVMLTQIVNLPTKFFIRNTINPNPTTNPSDSPTNEQIIAQFDRQMKGIKIPQMLLERLKKEFD